MAEFGAWTLATCGLAVVGIGLVFAILRPALLPEDRRYLDAPAPALDEVLPALARWLKKVFIVMGGGSSVGLMAVVNIVLRSDFRRPLIALAAMWAASVTLAAFGT